MAVCSSVRLTQQLDADSKCFCALLVCCSVTVIVTDCSSNLGCGVYFLLD